MVTMNRDEKTLERIRLLHPKVREEGEKIYNEICSALTGKAICRFAYTVRTWAEQDGLYAIGRTLPGKVVTQARGGESYHNYGLAIDIVLLVDKDNNGSFEAAAWDTKSDFDGDGKSDWLEVVTIFKKYGWEAGIDWGFKDPPHFQKSLGLSVMDLKNRYENKKVDQNNYVTLYT
jgi:peptidoglycan L-alanyl-D-glutamate endopeptidase CwlK